MGSSVRGIIVGYIYRYVDIIEDTIKYVGIVYANRSLRSRIKEHIRNDDWAEDSVWKVEYQEFPNMSRTDLEYLESHLISYYRTYRWYNTSKGDWGASSLVNIDEDKWVEFDYINTKYEEILTQKTRDLYVKLKQYEALPEFLDKQIRDTWEHVLEAETTGDKGEIGYYKGQFVALSKLRDEFKSLDVSDS